VGSANRAAAVKGIKDHCLEGALPGPVRRKPLVAANVSAVL
jgi:hypothetical protein